MTFRDIVGAMLRFWYVCLVILAAIGILSWRYDRTSGCYTTDTLVTFTKPATSTLQLGNGTNDPSLISFAGAIVNEINGGHSTPLYATTSAPIYGAGVRQGISVGLPNGGGQWSNTFATAAIQIQIVGRTPGWVEGKQRWILARISQATRSQQSTTPSAGHIAATVEPLSTEIHAVLPTRSSRWTAFAALGLAGAISAGTASIVADGLVGFARARRDAWRRNRFAASSLMGVAS